MILSTFGDPKATYARVIADSVSRAGDRITTMEVQCHRFVLAEFNTHRAFSRNSASSRAIPFEKQLERMEDLGIAFPLSWPKEKRGMQGGEEFELKEAAFMYQAWDSVARVVAQAALTLHSAGLHKSVVNRLLEPFMWHKIIVTATEWDNFFYQRCSPLAQPEIRVLAEFMQEALEESVPTLLESDNWHLPYLTNEDKMDIAKDAGLHGFNGRATQISSARCARVSYLTHEGIRSHAKDLDLYSDLRGATPPHWSPMEHPARPAKPGENTGNFQGWTQLRGILASGGEV